MQSFEFQDYLWFPTFCLFCLSISQYRTHRLKHWSAIFQRVSMSSLLQDQLLRPSCCDKTVSSDSPDVHQAKREPLQGLKLAPHAVLEEAQKRGRLKCSKCGGSRMFFCYTCCLLVGVTPKEIPSIKVSESLKIK